MPVLRVEDPDTGQVVDVPWEGEGVPDAETIRAARQKALAARPKPAVVGLVDMLREATGEIADYNKVYPIAGGPLWAAKKTAEFAGRQLAKVRRPVDRALGHAVESFTESAPGAAWRRLAVRTPPGILPETAQAAARQRALMAAERLKSGGSTYGGEAKAALLSGGEPQTKLGAAGSVVGGIAADFATDPSNLFIAGLGLVGRLGAQLQYVLGAALTGTAGLGAAQKAKEVAVLASEGKLNSPTAAAAATEGLLSALMAGFGARGVMKGWSRDKVLGEIERAQKEADMLAAEGVQATPPEVAGAVGFLKPLLLRHEKLRTEFNKNVKGMHKRQIDALRKAMADLEANPTDEQAAKVYESLRGEAEAPGGAQEPEPLTLYRGNQLSSDPTKPNLTQQVDPVNFIDELAGRAPSRPSPKAEEFHYYTESPEVAKSYADWDVNTLKAMVRRQKELYGGREGFDPEAAGLEMFRTLHGRDPVHNGQVTTLKTRPSKTLDLSELGETPRYGDLMKALEAAEGGKPRKPWELDELLDISNRTELDSDLIRTFRLMRNTKDAPQGAAKFRQWLADNGYDSVRFAENGTNHYAFLSAPKPAAHPSGAPEPAVLPPAASATTPAPTRSALLIPAREPNGSTSWEWATPGGKSLSGSFPSREAALSQRPEGYRYLDDGHQPLPEDVQAVRPPAKAPLLKQVRMSGDRDVLFRFTGDEPINLLQFRALTHKYGGTVEALGNDAFLDTPDTQKFRIGFPTPEAARKALADFESATTPLEASPPALPPAPPTQPPAPPSTPSGGNRHPIPDSAVASLRSWIGQHAQRDPITALHAQEGLDRLLGLGDQRIPLQGSERSALRKVFGKDAHNIFREYDASVAAERTPLQKGRDLVLDLLFNSSRALQSSEIGPSSATLRQGGPVAIYQTLTHPIKTARDVFDSARSFFSPQVYRGIQKDMANSSYIYRPAAPGKPPVKVDLTRLMDEFGVERATKEMGPEQANEVLNDYFSQGDVIQKAPVVGEVVKGANRAYAAVLDPFRRSTFAAMDELMRDAGMTPETHPSDWQMAGAATNQLTGLAKLPKIPLPGGKSLDLNVGSGNQLVRMLYYAPRFFYSRLFNLADTVTAGARFQNSKSLHDFFTKLEPVHPVRKQYLKIMGSYAAFWGTILYAASHLPGVEVETDPRSSDVVKMKVGDTRFDVWSGLQQPLRFFAQMASGQRKSNESGAVSPIPGSPGNYARRLATELSTGEAAPPDKTGPFTSDAEDVTGTFMESKESPAVSYFRDIQRGGKDVFGREADLNPLTRFLPFGMRDVREAAKSNPALAPAVAAAASLGIGTQTYQPRKPAGVGEAETKVKALRATQDEPKPEPAPEEKLTKRVKKGARAEYELKIREAMAQGDDLAAMEAVIEAKQAGFNFRELRKKIMGYDTREDEDEE